MALLDVNGQIVQSYQTGNAPGIVTWPGSLEAGSAHLSLTPELPGRESAVKFDGPWALKRLLDSATITRNGDNLEARFVIGGRDVAYTVQISLGRQSIRASGAFRFQLSDKFQVGTCFAIRSLTGRAKQLLQQPDHTMLLPSRRRNRHDLIFVL